MSATRGGSANHFVDCQAEPSWQPGANPGELLLLLDQANAAGKKDEPGFTPKQLSTKARALLMSQRWPGNVRELEHTLMRATVWADDTTISETELRATTARHCHDRRARAP